MKRVIAILLLSIMTLFVFAGCKREGEMIETMVSSIFSTENRNNTNDATASSGRVTDDDGHIGNEKDENTTASGLMDNFTSTTDTLDDNVI